jgi:hypothetical protein
MLLPSAGNEPLEQELNKNTLPQKDDIKKL